MSITPIGPRIPSRDEEPEEDAADSGGDSESSGESEGGSRAATLPPPKAATLPQGMPALKPASLTGGMPALKPGSQPGGQPAIKPASLTGGMKALKPATLPGGMPAVKPAGTPAAAPQPAAAPAPAPPSPEQVRASVAERVRALEEKARALAASGDFESQQLAAQVIKLGRKIAEAAEAGGGNDALAEAVKSLVGPQDLHTIRLAELVSSARAGLMDLLDKAPNDTERKRVETLLGVYAELDECCSEIANSIVSNNMARRKLLLPKVAAATAKAKEGIEAAKGAVGAAK